MLAGTLKKTDVSSLWERLFLKTHSWNRAVSPQHSCDGILLPKGKAEPFLSENRGSWVQSPGGFALPSCRAAGATLWGCKSCLLIPEASAANTDYTPFIWAISQGSLHLQQHMGEICTHAEHWAHLHHPGHWCQSPLSGVPEGPSMCWMEGVILLLEGRMYCPFFFILCHYSLLGSWERVRSLLLDFNREGLRICLLFANLLSGPANFLEYDLGKCGDPWDFL